MKDRQIGLIGYPWHCSPTTIKPIPPPVTHHFTSIMGCTPIKAPTHIQSIKANPPKTPLIKSRRFVRKLNPLLNKWQKQQRNSTTERRVTLKNIRLEIKFGSKEPILQQLILRRN